MSLAIKLCGITTAHDAALAIEAGATWIGLIFVPGTPRYIPVEVAREIADAVRGQARLVGVFQDQPVVEVSRFAEAIGLDFVQLHGQEPVEFCQSLPVPVIKTIHLNAQAAESALPYLTEAAPNVSYLLLEQPKHFSPPDAGASRGLAAVMLAKPCFVAGGLTPENIDVFLAGLPNPPYGVDAASGVELKPGVKDPLKVRAFCRAVQNRQLSEV